MHPLEVGEARAGVLPGTGGFSDNSRSDISATARRTGLRRNFTRVHPLDVAEAYAGVPFGTVPDGREVSGPTGNDRVVSGTAQPSEEAAASSTWGSMHHAHEVAGNPSVQEDSAASAIASSVSSNSDGREPLFHDSWRDAFKSETYDPIAIRVLTAIMSIYMLGLGIYGALQDEGFRGEWGGLAWAVFHSTPRLAGGTLSLIVFAVFQLECLRRFCVQSHDVIAAVWIVTLYAVQMSEFVLTDLRNADTGGGGVAAFQFQNITFAGGDCSDSNPEGTLLLASRGMAQPGCSANVVSGEAMAVGGTIVSFPLILRVGALSAWGVTAGIALSYISLSCLSIGGVSPSSLSSLALQLAASISASVLCGMTLHPKP